MSRFNLIIASLAFATAGASAQSFDVAWFSIDAGAAVLTDAGGDLEMSVTVGQPDAGFLSGGEFEMTGGVSAISSPCDPCDVNCDGVIDAYDIEPFIDLLVGPNPLRCSSCAGDANGDSVIDAFDIEPFVNCIIP